MVSYDKGLKFENTVNTYVDSVPTLMVRSRTAQKSCLPKLGAEDH